MWLLRSCCCCSLRGGALAVGIVFLAFSVVQLLGVLIGWGVVDAIRAHSYRRRMEAARSGSSDYYYYYGADHLPGVEILAPMTVVVLVQLVFDSLLVHGVRVSPTRPLIARRCLASWIIFRAVIFGLFSLGALGLLITAIILRYTRGEYESTVFGGNFVPVAIIAGVCWYGWTAVLSFYWHLRSADTGGITYNTVQMQTTRMAAPRDAGVAEAAGSGTSGGDQRDGQKWA